MKTRYYPLIKPLARGATEISGLYWEDFHPGDVFEHRPGRTVLDADSVVYLLTQCVRPVHFDATRQQNGMEKLLVDSTFTLALLTGECVLSAPRSWLGWDGTNRQSGFSQGIHFMLKALYSANACQIVARTEGIVTVRTYGINRVVYEVMRFERTMLVIAVDVRL